MSMQFKYGTYTHAAGEVWFDALQKVPMIAGNGFQYGITETWRLNGFLQAADQGSVDAAVAALAAAYSVNFQDAAFYLESGAKSTLAMPGISKLGGVRVMDFQVVNGKGGAWSTFAEYSITLEGKYEIFSSIGLIKYHESVGFTGGGPRFGFLIPTEGQPQKQLLSQQSTWKAQQTGEAVGLLTWPLPSPPIWQSDEHEDQGSVTYDSPQRQGGNGQAVYFEYRVTWSYPFESASPLNGKPGIWK